MRSQAGTGLPGCLGWIALLTFMAIAGAVALADLGLMLQGDVGSTALHGLGAMPKPLAGPRHDRQDF
jgi:hypothetical protein